MNFNFSKICLPTLPTPRPLELFKLLEHCKDSLINSKSILIEDFLNLDYPNLRDLDEIIYAIDCDQSESIQLLEWLYCIFYKSEWDTFHQNRSLSTSQKIWLAANHIEQLKKFLFWDLALTHGSNCGKKLADSLVEGFKSFSPKTDEDKIIIYIINVLAGESSDILIAKMSQRSIRTPQGLFNSLKLPTYKIQALVLAYNHIADLFIDIKTPNNDQVQWLLYCLEEMSVNQEIEAIDKLLVTIGSEIGIHHPTLVRWISAKYSSGDDNYYWNQLSSRARQALRKWQGAVNYGDFQKLVDIVLYHSNIYLEGYERKQLQNRQIFWSNYTDRFERIRILLPQSSFDSIGDRLRNQEIGVLEDDGSKTEVCIFDFKKWVVIEFFRGSDSETRIIFKTPELERTLFHSNNLSVSSIRHLGGDIHDHKFGWQNACVTWLMEKDIWPNEDIKSFKITPDFEQSYNTITGLPPLSKDNAEKRERALKRW
jgi:hypothetical protein